MNEQNRDFPSPRSFGEVASTGGAEYNPPQRTARGILRALEIVELVQGLLHGLDDVAKFPILISARNGQVSEVTRCFAGSGIV
jgi:hypothetical protein